MTKMKIFLGDLVHTWEKSSIWTMRLNIGFIAAYADKVLNGEAEFTLFKRPEEMIEAIKSERPDVVGLSYYVWNTRLNHRVLRLAKKLNPDVLTVGGGPVFTPLNANEDGARKFFGVQKECDVYVTNQGERGFAEVLRRLKACGGNVDLLCRQPIDGTLVNGRNHPGEVLIGTPIPAIRDDLDEIPSPYLNGMLDTFFDDAIIPIIESNRSCPYRCTFCAWGIGNVKLAKFSEDRVLAEIDYIGARCKKTANLYVADANFGILERDAAFAKRLYECHRTNGYPGHVAVQWNKTRPDRVLKTAQEFNGIAEIGASMQSLSEDVLKAIKRRNLSLEQVQEMHNTLSDIGQGNTLFSELIVGLPEETWQSHLDANKQLMDLGAEVFNYNLHLLPGTEMDTLDNREKYFHRTGWRLHDNAYGIYEGEKVFEGQEVVLATSTMSSEELRSFRFIHFLLQFMWGRRWYFDFLYLFNQNGLHPVDMVVKIADEFIADGGEMGKLYKDFCADHDLENFSTADGLFDYWAQDEPFERLRSGTYGKLNYYFTYVILLDHQEAFHTFLMNLAQKLVTGIDVPDQAVFLGQCEDILRFSKALRVTLSDCHDIVDLKRESFQFDVLAWRLDREAGGPKASEATDRNEYEFFLPNQQHEDLKRQLAQFGNDNINRSFRKMSEDTSPEQFFYQVRSIENLSYHR